MKIRAVQENSITVLKKERTLYRNRLNTAPDLRIRLPNIKLNIVKKK
jgi:hypothetical protein